MNAAAISRLSRALLVLLAVSFLTFIVGHDSGDPVLLLARGDATAAQKQDLRHSLGLDRPVMAQYGTYLRHALHGDLGESYRQHLPVTRLIALRLPASLLLAATAFLLAMSLALLSGLLCVIYRDSVLDRAVAGLAVLSQVVPGFWLGLVLVLIFAVHLGLLPVSGAGDLRHLVLPAVTLALPTFGRMSRMVRTGILDALNSDYIRTARAKGLPERDVLLHHALKNALLPLITQAGLELGDMVGNAFIIEIVFAWPGIGRMTIESIQQRDFLVAQGCVLIIGTGFVLINLAVDLMYVAIDPRVRAQR
jgi:ABC-type dipeptide/oligopeptide/nickel transport system permease component